MSETLRWRDVTLDPPPEDGTPILVCGGDWNQPWRLFWAPTTAIFGTYHPNAKGKTCWRSTDGHKLSFRYWMPQLPVPQDSAPQL